MQAVRNCLYQQEIKKRNIVRLHLISVHWPVIKLAKKSARSLKAGCDGEGNWREGKGMEGREGTLIGFMIPRGVKLSQLSGSGRHI